MTAVTLKRRPFLARLWRSYHGWRKFFGRRESLRLAWQVARFR